MDGHLPVQIRQPEVEIKPGTTAARPVIVVDESEDEAEPQQLDVKITDDNTLKEFTCFPDLPIELRLQVWNLAFLPRVVNILYDEKRNQSFTWNSSPPMLLQIHRETRELGLKTYTQCFGADPHQSVKHRVWIDFGRDIILTSDDYLCNTIKLDLDPGKPLNPLQHLQNIQPELVQHLAISLERFEYHPTLTLNTVTGHFLDFFPTLKNLYLVYEDGVDPYSRGRIRLFDMERTCHESCEDKGCRSLALIAAQRQDAINKLRDSMAILARGVNVLFVGAWRGGSRYGFGHALDEYEDEPDDESYDPKDGPWDGYESDRTDASESAYDVSDDEETLFSDREGWQYPADIPESEDIDLREDNVNYEKLLAEDPNRLLYETKQGQALDLIMRNANDYYEWRRQNGGKCYPIYHPDGNYRAL